MTTPETRWARPLLRAHTDVSLAADTLMLGDGTIWSHAATLGTRTKGGEEFCLDRGCIENFVKVFTSGYPQKIPVDYNHSSTTNDPVAVGLGYQGSLPKAGDVLELKGVFAASDFTGDLKAAAEKLATQAGRTLDDPRNLGLWMRWKPTSRALMAIKAGEYTELSIAFDDDLPNNVDGAGQGPGLWAVALLNTPFLDDMLPVAASRSGDSPPARNRAASPESQMTTTNSNTKLLSLVAAVRGKPVATEDEAITELTAHQAEVTELRRAHEFREILGAEFAGEKDPAKMVAAIRELRSQVKVATEAATEQKKVAIKTTVETTIKEYEGAIASVPLREMMTRNLTKELEDGTALDKTSTLATLKSLSPASVFGQRSAADAGGAGIGDDEKITARANELLEKDPQLKALGAKDWAEGFRQATQRAAREFRSAATA